MNTKLKLKIPNQNRVQYIRGTNLKVKIIAEIEEHQVDGLIKRYVLLEVRIKGKGKKRVKVIYDEFLSGTWIDIYIGLDADIDYSIIKKSALHKEITQVSTNRAKEIKFQKTGYIEYENSRYFSYQGGAIVANDNILNLSTNATGTLKNCNFPKLDEADDSQLLVRQFLDISSIAPKNYALGSLSLMSVMRAPLTIFRPIRVTVWIVGKTGSRKTAISVVLMQCFGPDFKEPPSNWSSTAKAIELELQLACSILWLIDDYTDAMNKGDAGQIIELVVGGTGNGSKRTFKISPMANAEVGAIQAIPLITAESIPDMIQSRKERCIFTLVEPNDVDNTALTKYQKLGASGDLSKVMRLYIHFILENYDRINNGIEAKFEEYRNGVTSKLGEGFHARVPSNYADLMLGLHYFLIFCTRNEYLTKEAAAELKKHHSENLFELLQLQSTLHETLDMKTIIHNKLSDYLKCGDFRLTEILGTKLSDKSPNKSIPFIGWIDRKNEHLYINSKNAHVLLDNLPDDLQKILGNGEKAFWANLCKYDFLAETDKTSKKNVVRKTINGKVRYVYSLDYSLMD